MAEPFEISGHEVVIGASIGIALAPRDGIDADLLLKNADMALYRAKADGRRAWRFFEHGMDVMAQARRNLQLDLRNALATNAFQVHYQPLLNLHTKRISTCEALLRWPHPERGMISPAEFIPVAEEMGLIVEIGDCVLREACAGVREMAGRRARRRQPVADPVPARQRRRRSSARRWRPRGWPPSRLEIEITESVFLNDTELHAPLARRAAARWACASRSTTSAPATRA